MSIPLWSPIADSEINPEAPITSSLMYRLRDQWAAFFGVDPTNPIQPAFVLPPSQMEVVGRDIVQCGGYVTNSAEYTIADLNNQIEINEIIPLPYTTDPNQNGFPWQGAIKEVKPGNTLPTSNAEWREFFRCDSDYTLSDFSIGYSGGSPSVVNVCIIKFDGYYSNGATATNIAVPINNTYQTIVGNIQFKARASGSIIYGQWHTTGGLAWCVAFANIRKRFVARG